MASVWLRYRLEIGTSSRPHAVGVCWAGAMQKRSVSKATRVVSFCLFAVTRSCCACPGREGESTEGGALLRTKQAPHVAPCAGAALRGRSLSAGACEALRGGWRENRRAADHRGS